MKIRWFEVICGALIVWAVVTSGVNGYRYLSAGSWPTATGYIEAWTVKKESEYEMEATAWVQYVYLVDDQVYRSWSLYLSDDRWLGRVFANEGQAIETLKNYPIGAQVAVHYNPLSPTDAALDPKSIELLPFLVIAVPAFLCLAIGLFLFKRRSPSSGDYPNLILAVVLGFALWWAPQVLSEDPYELLDGGAKRFERLKHLTRRNRELWARVKKGASASELGLVARQVQEFDDGRVIWKFPVTHGYEKAGFITFEPGDKGLLVISASPPFYTTLEESDDVRANSTRGTSAHKPKRPKAP